MRWLKPHIVIMSEWVSRVDIVVGMFVISCNWILSTHSFGACISQNFETWCDLTSTIILCNEANSKAIAFLTILG